MSRSSITGFGCSSLLAQTLATYGNVDSGIDLGNGYSDVFKQDADTGIIKCGAGFDQRYEKPHSKGGKYVTLSDLNNIFTIGIQHGQAKLRGWKARWDSDFCNAIGGYPRGSILRTQNGIRMISRIGNNTQPVPETGESNQYWKRIMPRPVFSTWHGRIPSSDRYSGGHDWLRLDMIPPTYDKRATNRQLVASFVGSGGLICFTSILHAYGDGSYVERIPLCKYGKAKVKISKYNDIYTNALHEDEFIEVLSFDQTKQITIKHPWGPSYKENVRMWSPHKMIPVKHGVTYYLYIEYEDAWTTGVAYGVQYGLEYFHVGCVLSWPSMD